MILASSCPFLALSCPYKRSGSISEEAGHRDGIGGSRKARAECNCDLILSQEWCVAVSDTATHVNSLITAEEFITLASITLIIAIGWQAGSKEAMPPLIQGNLIVVRYQLS